MENYLDASAQYPKQHARKSENFFIRLGTDTGKILFLYSYPNKTEKEKIVEASLYQSVLSFYLTYWNQRVGVIFTGVDCIVITVAADSLPLYLLEGRLSEAGVYLGVVGVDGADLAPPGAWHQMSEGRVMAQVLVSTSHMRHVTSTWLATQRSRYGVKVRVQQLPVNIVSTCG